MMNHLALSLLCSTLNFHFTHSLFPGGVSLEMVPRRAAVQQFLIVPQTFLAPWTITLPDRFRILGGQECSTHFVV